LLFSGICQRADSTYFEINTVSFFPSFPFPLRSFLFGSLPQVASDPPFSYCPIDETSPLASAFFFTHFTLFFVLLLSSSSIWFSLVRPPIVTLSPVTKDLFCSAVSVAAARQ